MVLPECQNVWSLLSNNNNVFFLHHHRLKIQLTLVGWEDNICQHKHKYIQWCLVECCYLFCLVECNFTFFSPPFLLFFFFLFSLSFFPLLSGFPPALKRLLPPVGKEENICQHRHKHFKWFLIDCCSCGMPFSLLFPLYSVFSFLHLPSFHVFFFLLSISFLFFSFFFFFFFFFFSFFSFSFFECCYLLCLVDCNFPFFSPPFLLFFYFFPFFLSLSFFPLLSCSQNFHRLWKDNFHQ